MLVAIVRVAMFDSATASISIFVAKDAASTSRGVEVVALDDERLGPVEVGSRTGLLTRLMCRILKLHQRGYGYGHFSYRPTFGGGA